MLRRIYAGWLTLITVLIVVQLYLAGYGVFAFNGLNGFGAHFLVGDLIGIAILISLGVAFAARVPRQMLIFNGALLVLMIIQFLLAHTGVAVISALHIVNGVVIMGVSGFMTRQGWMLAQAAEKMPA
jgi:uncharacterized protein DUF6220